MLKNNILQPVFQIDAHRRTPKYLQIVHSVTKAIRQGQYKKGDRIFSINELSNECLLSRDTVQKAYDILAQDKIIEAVRGKGFYVSRTNIVVPYRVLLVFNKLSAHKKMIYDSFVHTLGNRAAVELKIHHASPRLFEDIIETSLGCYDYYVLMPHFCKHTEQTYNSIHKIPQEQLILLDKDVPTGNHIHKAVYQDFERDIAEALEAGVEKLRKYTKLIYVHSKLLPHPVEIIRGFRNFCFQYHFQYGVREEISTNESPKPGEAYIVADDTDLVRLIKNCRIAKLKVGKDIGIISYNETPLKEILLGGISVISTDHTKMGEAAARLILENREEKIRNPFSLIMRKSL